MANIFVGGAARRVGATANVYKRCVSRAYHTLHRFVERKGRFEFVVPPNEGTF